MITQRVLLKYKPEEYGKPLSYILIKNFDLMINILKASISPGQEGRLLLDITGTEEQIAEGLNHLQSENIEVVPASFQISLEEEKCVHCGACTAVCFVNSLTISEASDWQLNFAADKCINCGLCINACPCGAIIKGVFDDSF